MKIISDNQGNSPGLLGIYTNGLLLGGLVTPQWKGVVAVYITLTETIQLMLLVIAVITLWKKSDK